MTKQEKAQKIIAGITGKNVAQRRRDALLKAGFNVSEIRTEWNFGTTGTVKEMNGKTFLQVAYATGGRARNGYMVNACPVVEISEQ